MADTVEREMAIDPEPPKRLLGIWILTLYALVFAGLMPLTIEALLLFSGLGGESQGVSTVTVVAVIGLSLAIVVTSIATWMGKSRARVFFVFFVTLYYILIALNGLLVQFSGDPSADAFNISRILMGFLIPPFYIWYFRRADVKQFFSD
jgi:lysylphosphatidylglycerol synthetase-like protein (DUF2156 family)